MLKNIEFVNIVNIFVMEVDMSKFNENSLSRVTVEDILDGIKDEYSVVYSRDGARLLKCDNIHITNYKIKDNTVVICDMASIEPFYNQLNIKYIAVSVYIY